MKAGLPATCPGDKQSEGGGSCIQAPGTAALTGDLSPGRAEQLSVEAWGEGVA